MSVNFSWPIFGHNKQISFLQNTLKQGNLANAYLFYGAKGLGKKMIAKYFVQSLFCTESTKPCQNCLACLKMNRGIQGNFMYLSALKNKDDNEDTQVKQQTILNLSFGKPGLALEYIEDNLVSFKKDCQFLLKILSDNTFVAWQDLEHWFGILKKANPQAKVYELAHITTHYLDLWQLLLRDILWHKLNRPVLNVLFSENIAKISQKYSVTKILNNLLSINKIRRQLKNNVTPQLVWENLVLDLKI